MLGTLCGGAGSDGGGDAVSSCSCSVVSQHCSPDIFDLSSLSGCLKGASLSTERDELLTAPYARESKSVIPHSTIRERGEPTSSK